MLRFIAAAALVPALAFGQAAPPATPLPSFRSVDMTVELHDLKGDVIRDPTLATPADPQCAKCAPLTLGEAIGTSMCSERREDAAESALSKAKRCTLGMALLGEKSAVLTAPQVTEIEARLINWGPIVAARVIPLIDPNADLSAK